MRNAKAHRRTPRWVWLALVTASAMMLPGAGLERGAATEQHDVDSVLAKQRRQVDELNRRLRERTKRAQRREQPISGQAEANDAEERNEAEAREICANHLRQIAIAMHLYAQKNKWQLPPAASHDEDGNPLLSWRVHILPWVEENELYKEFHLDEPWDSPHNRKLISRMPAVFACPNQKSDAGKTCYLVPVGETTLFPPNGQRFPLKEIPDGTSNTILCLEVNDEHTVIWTKPDNLDYNPNENSISRFLGHHRGGFNIVFADGHALFVRETVDPETIHRAINRGDGQPLNF